MTYLADVATLARKDLRLELRARDTLPAMLLFVLSTLVVFHFALPTRCRRGRGAGIALGGARLHGAARAWRGPGRRSARAARSRGSCSRRPTGARSGSGSRPRSSSSWLRSSSSRCPPSRSSSHRSERRRFWRPARERRHLRRRHAAGGDGGREPHARADPAAAVPAARDSARRRRRRRQRLDRTWALSAFLGLYDAVFAILCWASFEYVVSE